MRSKHAIAAATVSLLVLAMTFSGSPAANGDECDASAASAADAIELGMICAEEAAVSMPISVTHGQAPEPIYTRYVWSSVCVMFDPSVSVSSSPECAASLRCPDPAERVWELWGRVAGPDEVWQPLGTECFASRPSQSDTPQPRITPALVLNEIRRIGLPTLAAKTQPEGKTLVNFDTIFYTEVQPFSATVTLLGQQVDIVAEPVEYAWRHGDGSVTTTASPGAPYPSKEITYRYVEADTTVRPRVDVTYSARFRVDGGAWQGIDETVTITGPEGTLRVSEARAVLSGNYG